MRRAVLDTANELLSTGADAKVSIVRFSSEAQPITPVFAADGTFESYFTDELAYVEQQIPLLGKTDRTTNFINALSEAYNEIRDELEKSDQESLALSTYHVILITDGIPDAEKGGEKSDGSEDIVGTVDALEALGSVYHVEELVLSTALLSSGNAAVDLQAEDLLQEMADHGNGTFRKFDSGGELNFLYIDLSTLRRVFTIRDGRRHEPQCVVGRRPLPRRLRRRLPRRRDARSGRSRTRSFRTRTATAAATAWSSSSARRASIRPIPTTATASSPTTASTTTRTSSATTGAPTRTRTASATASTSTRTASATRRTTRTATGTVSRTARRSGRARTRTAPTPTATGSSTTTRCGSGPRPTPTTSRTTATGMPCRTAKRCGPAPTPRPRRSAAATTSRTATRRSRVPAKSGDGSCQAFHISNITLTEPLSTDTTAGGTASLQTGWPGGQGYAGANRILVYAGEVPFDDPESYARFRVACVTARFVADGNYRNPPSGVIQLGQDVFVDLPDFDPAVDCADPGDELTGPLDPSDTGATP